MKPWRLVALAFLLPSLFFADVAVSRAAEPNAIEKTRFLLGTWNCKSYLSAKDPPDPRDLGAAYTVTYSILSGSGSEAIEGRQVFTKHYRIGDVHHATEVGDSGWSGSTFLIFDNPDYNPPGVSTIVYNSQGLYEARQRLLFAEVGPGAVFSGSGKWVGNTLMIQLFEAPLVKQKRLSDNSMPPLELKRLSDKSIEWITPSETVTAPNGLKGSNLGGVDVCTRG